MTLPAPVGRRLGRRAGRRRTQSAQASIGVAFAALAGTTAGLWLVAWALVVPVVRGWTPTVVMSGSMAPAIGTGAGTTGRYVTQSPAGSGVTSGGADSLQGSAGATGSASFTLSGGQRWIATTIALRPAPAHYTVRSVYLNWRSMFSNEA